MPKIPAVTRPFPNRSANRNGRDHLISEIERIAFHSILPLLPKPCLALGMGSGGWARALDISGGWEKKELNVKKGDMSTVVTGEADKVFEAMKQIFLSTVKKGPVSMVVAFSNACPI